MRNKRFVFVTIGALAFGLLAAVSVSRYLWARRITGKNLSVLWSPSQDPLGQREPADQLTSCVTKGTTPEGLESG